jgi:hypothetical protein
MATFIEHMSVGSLETPNTTDSSSEINYYLSQLSSKQKDNLYRALWLVSSL